MKLTAIDSKLRPRIDTRMARRRIPGKIDATVKRYKDTPMKLLPGLRCGRPLRHLLINALDTAGARRTGALPPPGIRALGAGLCLCAALAGCSPETGDNTAAQTPNAATPQGADTGPGAISGAGASDAIDNSIADEASEAMVVTANPLASEAGAAVLRAGGSAVDAAVAIESVLSLVEPQSSGLGGGAFMTYFDSATRTISIYDGRETAPAGAHSDMFLDADGEPYGYLEAKNSGLSIGVPGAVAMLASAHADHGKLPWAELFDRAKSLATEGFDVSPRLRSFFTRYGGRLIPRTAEEGPLDAYNYFFDERGKLRERLTNPAYAETLEAISADPGNFYRGPIAEAIAAAAQLPPRAGSLTTEDIAAYRSRKHQPLCVPYRSLRVCGPPPPSSWVAVGMILGMLESLEFPSDDRLADWATFTEVQRLAYADRDHFVADDTTLAVPIEGMLNPEYLAQRASLVAARAAERIDHGDPWAFTTSQTAAHTQAKKIAKLGRDTTVEHAGTTHFVVIDKAGNVVSMTATVESIFGSARMAKGMFLNNQLTDFAKAPRDAAGALVANHPAAGKRPRSSMSPTIALDANGDFYLATGSPGGSSIIAYTAKSLVGMIDWQLTPQEAVNLPNVVARGDRVRVESVRADAKMIQAMRDHGFQIRESEGENSGLSVILRGADGRLTGGVDPRREGTIAALKASAR